MITAAEIQMIRNANPGAILPGIDTKTGNAASSLINLTSITQNSKAPYYYSLSKNIVYVNQAGAVLSGINFGSDQRQQCHDQGQHVHRNRLLGRVPITGL
jgi:hypothetical protein